MPFFCCMHERRTSFTVLSIDCAACGNQVSGISRQTKISSDMKWLDIDLPILMPLYQKPYFKCIFAWSKIRIQKAEVFSRCFKSHHMISQIVRCVCGERICRPELLDILVLLFIGT